MKSPSNITRCTLLKQAAAAGVGTTPATNPEPATLSLLAMGGLAVMRRMPKKGIRTPQPLQAGLGGIRVFEPDRAV